MTNPVLVKDHLKNFFGYQQFSDLQEKDVQQICEEFQIAREVFLAALLVARWGSNQKFKETIETLEQEGLNPTGDQLNIIHRECDNCSVKSEEIIKNWRNNLKPKNNNLIAKDSNSFPVKDNNGSKPPKKGSGS